VISQNAVWLLITTGGVHLKSQKPFDMKDPKGGSAFREIPAGALPENLIITHNYYDHGDADKDINIVIPIERVSVYPKISAERYCLRESFTPVYLSAIRSLFPDKPSVKNRSDACC
jgi:hypothetical protein